MKKLIALVVTVLLLSNMSFRCLGQEIVERINALNSTKYNDWVRTFREYYAEKEAQGITSKSGTGFKQVSRLLNYYKNRLDANGNIVNTELYNWKAYKDFVQQNSSKTFATVSPQNGSWNYGGPYNIRGLDNKVAGIGRIAFIKLDPNDAGNANSAVIYVGTPKGGLWKGTFNKSTGLVPGWINMTDGLPNIGASDLCIHPANRNIMYLVSGDKESGINSAPSGIGILKTTDGGATWLPTGYFDDTPPNFNYGNIRKLVMDNSNPLRMWAVTTNGIVRTTDGWETFTTEISGNFWDLEKGRNSSNQNLIACTSSRVYTSNDYGNTWTTVKQNSPNQTLDYTFSGARAQICVSENFGSDRSFYLWYVTGDRNTTTSNIKLYSGGSSAWSDKYTGTDLVHVYVNYCMAFECSQSNSNFVYAGGVGLKQSSNAGDTWTDLSNGVSGTGEFSSGIHADQHFIAWDQGHLFLGNDGGVYNYNYGSGGWRYLSDGMYITQYYRLAYLNNANGFNWLGGAQDNGTHRQSSFVLGADGMEALIDYNTPATMYASYQGANVLKSTNNGVNWSNFMPTGFQNDNVWITPMAMHKTNPAIIALAELNGSNGAIDIYNGSWDEKVSTAGAFVWLAFAKSAPNVLYGITDSKIIKISDVTAASPTINTYTLPTSGATSVTVDPNNSAHVFYTVGGYVANKVYESTNSGLNWTPLTLNLPNVPVNCILMSESANDDVYVGTDLGVFVKLGTWNYWAPFMNGLPNTQITDLDIGGSLLTCATYGRGRWFTNLYSNCVPELDLTPSDDPSNGITTGDQYYTAADSISSTRIITGGAGSNVTYRAGKSITLKPGFHAKENNEFLGMIGPCFPGGPAPLGGVYDSSYARPEVPPVKVASPKYDYMRPKF